ncbi:etoposide-induced protein 2.4-domain-containing protein [Flammula alnicola]|nr:etoposide-induced protein 2.4-domain-containing protein [Flammula alnicola]
MSTAPYATRPQSFRYAGQTPRLSSRSSYPMFLSVQDSVFLQLTWAWRGLYDAFRWNVVFGSVASDSEIRANVYKSVLLNSLSLLSIYIFDLLLLPLVQDQQKWFHRNIGWFYQVLWLLPVVGTSLYLNGTWCTIIAKRTYLLQHGGRPAAPQSTSYTGMLKAIATSAYRVVMVCTSVVVSFALGKIPLVGPTAGFTFLCWVDAYYCFEFVWIARGLSLSRRIRYLEERWAYYFAFGLPSAALCTWGSGLANAALFALVFPVYIIMAMHARPVPTDPYNPMTPIPSQRPEENDIVRHPSPFVPIRLPIFAPVIWLNDGIVKILNVIGGRPIVGHKAAAGRGRGFSDASESAEDGVNTVQMELQSLKSSSSSSSKQVRPTSGRIKIGSQRKLD